MRNLTSAEIDIISGAGENVWYNIGHAVGTAYVGAVSGTADFFCWIDGLDGSLAD